MLSHSPNPIRLDSVSPAIRQLCIFCGSSAGSDPSFAREAERLGASLAKCGIGVVYGGGSKGLMGAVARGTASAGGTVKGISLRRIMELEGVHAENGSLIAATPHQRRLRMYRGCQGYLTLPGGLGTLEELAEVWCWAHLGLHTKPHWLLNLNGYFDHLLHFVEHGIELGFCRADAFSYLRITPSVEELLSELRPKTLQASAE